MRNFAYPYFSRDMAEFWRRWHISLSTWFRDYVYFPLGGSRVSRGRAIRNIFVIFFVSGLWHGANWTFVVWGGLNAVYFLPLFVLSRNRQNLEGVAQGRILPAPREAAAMLTTFGLTCLAWVFFRADSVGVALAYLGSMVSPPWIHPLRYTTLGLGLGAFMLVTEWFQREEEHGLAVHQRPAWLRRAAYVTVILIIMKTFGTTREFIYFQF
jgi:D-alanyl-lipoteichoic acid acyltransferase DltB (MBOAT superfamily)